MVFRGGVLQEIGTHLGKTVNAGKRVNAPASQNAPKFRRLEAPFSLEDPLILQPPFAFRRHNCLPLLDENAPGGRRSTGATTWRSEENCESAAGAPQTGQQVHGACGPRERPVRSAPLGSLHVATGRQLPSKALWVRRSTRLWISDVRLLSAVADGQVETWNCSADEAGLVQQLRELGCRIEHVVYETGPTGFSLYRALRAWGFNASVVAASRIPRGAAAAAKSDRIDATKLATYFAKGLLRAVAVPSVEEEGYRALVRRRKRVGEALAKLEQKIKGLLLATGVEEPASAARWTRTVTDDLARLALGPGHHSAMASIIREYGKYKNPWGQSSRSANRFPRLGRHSRDRSQPSMVDG